MPVIHVMSETLASQVAAGEVVERPASVVKELIENSLDAGARDIVVEIEKGGVALMRVTDDGVGMEPSDARLALERHATSKLRSSDDLNAISTLGFRGEALPSIASVSRLRLVSNRRDQVCGRELMVEGGRLLLERDAGSAPGTVVEVRQLFYNVPARRKFLKSESTEFAHVEQVLRVHALAAPHCRFRLRRDEREVMDWPAVVRKGDRLRQMLGRETADELIEVPRLEGNGCAVEGFLLPALHARKGRKHQCVMLNQRPVEDAVIARALIAGFRGGLIEGMNPAAWLWIDMNPLWVDVNVHPAKREVRLHRPLELHDLIAAAVERGLQAVESRRRPLNPPAAAMPMREPRLWSAAEQQLRLPTAQQPVVEENVLARETSPQDSTVEVNVADMRENTDIWQRVAEESRRGAAALRIIDLLLDRWVLLENSEGLVVLDPRAARERIVYEHLMQQADQVCSGQGLLVPLLLELEPRERDIVWRQRDGFLAMGVELRDFGGNTLQVTAFPAVLENEQPLLFLRQVIDDLLLGMQAGARAAQDRLARVLAKRASQHERACLETTPRLLEELFRCHLPYCAADGRPTMTELSTRELERRLQGRG